jgi:hypothetical protein
MDGIFNIFFCFTKRQKEEEYKKSMNISKSTIFTILEENKDNHELEARQIIDSQADISIFDFEKLKEFFDT